MNFLNFNIYFICDQIEWNLSLVWYKEPIEWENVDDNNDDFKYDIITLFSIFHSENWLVSW